MPAPYLVTSGIRDSAVWETPDGVAVQWLALGEGSIGIEAVAKRFGELCPAKPLSLEIINTRIPRLLDSWTEECWDAYRDVPASFLARFQKLGRNGNPYSNVPPGPPGVSPDSAEFKAFLVEQERRDIEQVVKVFKRRAGPRRRVARRDSAAGRSETSNERVVGFRYLPRGGTISLG